MSKVNLYDVHDDLSVYFSTILKTNLQVIKLLSEQLMNKELDLDEYNIAMKQYSLAPAVLTAISTFLKTNDIMVIPDDTVKALSDFEQSISDFKKAGVKNLDHTQEIN